MFIKHSLKFSLGAFVAMVLSLSAFSVGAQEDVIRKTLTERYPTLPKVQEVNKTAIAGIYEVRIGNDIIYTDAAADFVFQGALIETKTQKNLTELRKEKLQEVPFDALPLKNAFKQVKGLGKRQLAIFVDPNCGYCKRLEKELQDLDNVTIHYILYPVLGDDSYNKAGHVWCAKEKEKVWLDWMLSGVTPPAANCNVEALAQNLAFGGKHGVSGTPTMFLSNGKRVTGAVPLARLDQLLNEAAK